MTHLDDREVQEEAQFLTELAERLESGKIKICDAVSGVRMLAEKKRRSVAFRGIARTFIASKP